MCIFKTNTYKIDLMKNGKGKGDIRKNFPGFSAASYLMKIYIATVKALMELIDKMCIFAEK